MARKQVVVDDRIAVVTVHGTGDSSPGPEGPKWWQRGSSFAERLTARLASHGVGAEIVPHIWTGANSASDRESGADTLASLIKLCAKKYRGVHVIGHSHGGNVANDAADFLRWGRRSKKRKEVIDSVTTVGTPYFNSKTGLPQKGAGWAFMGVTWGSVILFPLVLIGWLIYSVATYITAGEAARARMAEKALTLDTNVLQEAVRGDHTPALRSGTAWLLYLVLIGLAIRFMWQMSTRGVRRVMRLKRMKDSPATIFSIWHPNDEAISFLQKVETIPLEAFPKGSLYRGSRSSAVGLGVLSVILAVSTAPALYFAYQTGPGKKVLEFLMGTGAETTAASRLSFLFVLLVMALLTAPAIFSLAFLIYRYAVGNILEWSARGFLNKRVATTLRGIAYGKDGDQELCNVSTTSHTINAKELTLTGPVAERMQQGAAVAANRLLEKYRWALFSVGADTNASLSTLSTDAMTWDSLIHTTYFDQPEVSDLIGDHIAAEAKKMQAAEAAEAG